MRLLAVGAVFGGGVSLAEAGRRYGVSASAVGKWVRAARAAGDAGVLQGRRGRRVGEVAKLSALEQARIVRLLSERNPDQLRLPFALWTREAVRELIRARCGVVLAIRTVGDYLRRWGFSPQKPAQRAYEQDAAAVAHWKVHAYPALRARAKREGARILWGDEMGLRSDHARGRSFSPVGQTPIVRKTGRRFGCNVIKALSNQGQLYFRVFDGRFTQTVFVDFLTRLLKTIPDRKLILIVDGHPGHRGRAVTRFVADHAERLELVFLPAYSPELNPAEIANNDTKHGALSRRPTSPEQLIADTRRHLHRRQKQPALVARYFTHPDVAYAA